MDQLTASQALGFRDEVRRFVATALPATIRAKTLAGRRLDASDYREWHRILFERGWAAPNWPKSFGGCEWNGLQQHIFEEECSLAGAPLLMPFGLRMCAPVIMAFGNAAQQQRFLPRILTGEDWWCQGYSEPGSGSDLASLRMRAERRGDSYVVNGQKTWTTLAQYADWIFCLVRTASDGRPQEGISFLLIDMRSKGVTVRPIVMLDGEHEINEVWFDDVVVPAENRVGEENKGWTYAKYLLNHERTGNAGLGFCRRWLADLKALARSQPGSDGRPLIEDVRFRDRIAQVEIDLVALERTNQRVLALEHARGAPGFEASLLKIKGTEIQQELTELMMKALGHDAVAWQPDALEDPAAQWHTGPDDGLGLTGRYLNFRKASIYAGSNEIQRNIIARQLLGL